MDTVIDRFVKVVSECRDKPALSYFDETWKELSYGTFLTYVRGLASHLAGSGMEVGFRIGIVSENRFEWCAAYLAILMAGGIAVPIDANLPRAEIGKIAEHAGVVLLFHSEKTKEKLTRSIKRIDFDSLDFKKILNTPETEFRVLVPAEDAAAIVYTSGTTAEPKGVVLTHGNFCSDADALIKFGIAGPNDNVLALLPLHHTYPFMCTFLVPILLGAKVTFPPSLKGPEIISTARERKVTVLVAVPQLLEAVRNRILRGFEERGPVPSFILPALAAVCKDLRKMTGLNLGKLIFRRVHQAFGHQFRFFTSGGARLGSRVMEDLEGFGFTILEGYGLTETSPVVTFNPLGKRKPGSAGKPMPSVELKILESLEKGEGEIAVRGPMVMSGYYNAPQATKEAFQDGWFLTGDLGYLDRDGYLFITGRRKEIIVLSSGMNIYPEEVEKEYLNATLIKEIGVLGLEGKSGTEGLFGIVVPDLDYAAESRVGNLREALKEQIGHASAGLPSHMRLQGFTIYQGTLPRTPLGKLKRHMLKELLSAAGKGKEEMQEEKELVGDPAGKRISDCLQTLLNHKRPIRLSDHLELDLGLDSLKRIELGASLEEAFSLKLPETFVSEVQTVRDVVSKIKHISSLRELVPGGPEWKDILSVEPSEEEKRTMDLGRIGEFLLISTVKGLRSLFRLFFKLEVKGTQNLPGSPLIIAPNHSSNIDGFIVAAVVGSDILRVLYFLGYSPMFKGAIRSAFARMAHIILVDPDVHLLKALRLSSYILRKGGSICIFPEGGRSTDGTITEFKKGVSILARSHDVPVVPTRIEGTFHVLPRGAIFPSLGPIKIIFGQPVRAAEFGDLSLTQEALDEDRSFAEFLRKKVDCLK
jgi:long-chain acyl-CoA synthetase